MGYLITLCTDVPPLLPKAPFNWFNQKLNGQYLGRKGRQNFLAEIGTLGRNQRGEDSPARHRGNGMCSVEER